MSLPRRSILLFALVAATCPSAADARPRPNVTRAGFLALPSAAADDAASIAGVSGITWLGDDRYAAVLDNSDRLLVFRLALSPTAAPEGVSDLRIVTLGERHDYEDVAPCPAALTARIAARRRTRGEPVPAACLLVCEEDTPAIRAIDLERGDLLGIVPVPEALAAPRPNRGLESLATDSDGGCIWTASEEAVPADGPAAAVGRATVVRIARIAVPGSGGAADAQFAYAVEPPHAFARVLAGEPLAGLVALASLGAGRLLVLERSGAPGLPPFASRLVLIDTASAPDVSALAGGLAQRPDLWIAKDVLWQDAPGCNLEGLCVGPPLADGRRVLVAVADNGGLGAPTQLLTLVLSEPPPPLDASPVAAVAALAGAALLLLRLTSPSPCSTR